MVTLYYTRTTLKLTVTTVRAHRNLPIPNYPHEIEAALDRAACKKKVNILSFIVLFSCANVQSRDNL